MVRGYGGGLGRELVIVRGGVLVLEQVVLIEALGGYAHAPAISVDKSDREGVATGDILSGR